MPFQPLATLAQVAQPLLNLPIIRRVRRNHALEHATITLLMQDKHPPRIYGGRSDSGGFTVWGEVETPQVEQAANDALRRMKSGEKSLALHPQCGTNLVTTGVLVSLAAWVTSIGVRRGARDFSDRLPAMLLLSLLALIFGPRLGMRVQEHFTTSGEPGELSVKTIEKSNLPLMGQSVTVHRITTHNG